MQVRILIVQTAFLGDVVLTLPLIEAVRCRFPQAQVDILTIPAHAPVLKHQPLVDVVLTYDKRRTQRGLFGLIQILRQIRVRRYDVVVSPHRSLRSAILVAGSQSECRIGFQHWLTGWAYTVTVPRSTSGHEVERNHQLLEPLGIGPAALPNQLGLQIDKDEACRAQAYFACQGVRKSDIVVGMIPGSQWGTKRWPAKHFASLIEQLSVMPNTHCVLFGGPQERDIADMIISASRAPVIDLIGSTALSVLPAYLVHCTVVVSNDTGPMHVAAAVGKPIVALYGPTIPDLGFSPYGVRWEEASVTLDCRPCNAHGPQRCPLSHWRCMRELAADQVAERVQALLQSTREMGEVGG